MINRRLIFILAFCAIFGHCVLSPAEDKRPAGDENVNKAYNWLVAQQESNRRFLFFTNGLLPSYEGGTDCFTYDQALACIAFTSQGDFKRAKLILDFFDGTYREQIKKYGKFIGFSDAYHKDGRWGETWAAGPNAWLLIAANHYTYDSKDTRYSELSEVITEWLISLQSVDGGIIGGYYGNGKPMTWISTEHNFDCYAAMRDLGVLTGDKRCLGTAKEIRFWLENAAWNKEQSRFNMGRDNPNFATDQSSWAVLSLGSKYGSTLDFAIEKSLNKKMYKVNNVEIEGFDFGSTYEKSHYPDKDAVWLEGTAQMVLAFDRAGRKAEKEHFLSELDKALTPSPMFKKAYGLPYATNEGTPAYGSWLMQDKPLCISSTSWYIFAKDNYNPFSMNQRDEEANKIVDSLEFNPNYQFTPVIDDFGEGDIKFETAYPESLIFAGGAKLTRGLVAISKEVQGGSAMEIILAGEPSATSSWGLLSRPFLYPQDWSKFGKLDISAQCADQVSMKVKIKDKEGEPFESRPVYFYENSKHLISLDLGNDFIRSPELPNYGNKKIDKEAIRELSFEFKAVKPGTKNTVMIYRISLQ